jgi:hypothetical protein
LATKFQEPRQALETGVGGFYNFATRFGLRNGSAAVASAKWRCWVGSALHLLASSHRSSPINYAKNSSGRNLPRACSRGSTRAVHRKWRNIGRLVLAEVCAEVVDQRVAIGGIDQRTPLRHLVDFFCPGRLAQPLLHDNPRFVALCARGCRLRLHGPGGKLGRRAGRSRFLSMFLSRRYASQDSH